MQPLIIRMFRLYWRKANKDTELLELILDQLRKQTEILEETLNQSKKQEELKMKEKSFKD